MNIILVGRSSLMGVIEDPNFSGFDGLYIGVNTEEISDVKYNIGAMCKYAQKERKKLSDLTKEEIEKFKID